MVSFNKVFLMGNLTRDPELRYTPQGTAVANLGLAVNRYYKDKSGQNQKDTCFLTIVAWGQMAEVCNQYLQKGSQILVEGKLQSRSWQDNEGKKRSTIEVRADNIQFMPKNVKPDAREVDLGEEPKEEPKDIQEPEAGENPLSELGEAVQ
ncbi:MAG: single-stranded DNA-binding protein [Candidatus Omnitrophica bacterium]|nr:single-stranded DNA-binding protein [Candidatus Omnitrophota bacterium]